MVLIRGKFTFFFVLFSVHFLQAQQVQLSGYVLSAEDSSAIEEVNISILNSSIGTSSNSIGFFSIKLDQQHFNSKLRFSHVAFSELILTIDSLIIQASPISLYLLSDTKMKEVVVRSDREREQVSVTKLDPMIVSQAPSPFQDISSIIATLPGVSSNNELSNQYSVRGGNFDENLVYVNDIPVHRPFLIRAGQQEGLSFVNVDMTESILFSAGGWQAQYGDALSSVMNIRYKEPTKQEGSFNAGLLGGSIYLSTPFKKNNGLSIGVRHKDSRYLVGNMDVAGEYFPTFTDAQAYYTHHLGRSGKTKLEVVFGYSRNNFRVFPTSRETDFGAFPSVYRLFVGFSGNEQLSYDIVQGGVNLSHEINDKWKSKLIVSSFYTNEREYTDIENAYLLCALGRRDEDTDDPCRINLGAGRNYEYRRNILRASNLYVENKHNYYVSEKQELAFGAGIMVQQVNDYLNEFILSDSVDFVSVNYALTTQNSLNAIQFFAYFQHQVQSVNNKHLLTYGARFTYWNYNNQLLISPRVQYTFRPDWKPDILFRFAAGMYQQPPFYRELRDFGGQLNENLKAQSSGHLVAGMDQKLKFWGRDFTFVTELWGKFLYNVIPYDIDNVRIRYYANNDARAYAAGADFRIGGEFIPGTDSWFSLGILNTRENLANDDRDYIRRPSDQRVRLGILFQDHLPNNPSIRMYLNLQVGTGLPFGPPNNEALRNSFVSPPYRRVDIGMSKEFTFVKNRKYLKSVWVSGEILNFLGSNNPISFSWFETVDSALWAIPNGLSARFFNIRTIARF